MTLVSRTQKFYARPQTFANAHNFSISGTTMNNANTIVTNNYIKNEASVPLQTEPDAPAGKSALLQLMNLRLTGYYRLSRGNDSLPQFYSFFYGKG